MLSYCVREVRGSVGFICRRLQGNRPKVYGVIPFGPGITRKCDSFDGWDRRSFWQGIVRLKAERADAGG